MADLTPEQRAHQIAQMSLRWLSLEEYLEKPWPEWERKISAEIRAAEQAVREREREYWLTATRQWGMKEDSISSILRLLEER